MTTLSADETDKKLRETSDSFCAAKWSQVLFNLQVGQRHNCCLGGPQTIDPDLIKKDLKYLFNDSVLIDERKAMLEGKKIAGCNVCWSAEAKGHHSDRHFKSSAEWSAPFFDKEKQTLDDVIPTYVEVSFGNKCQMMCTYCSPSNSSSLAKESKKFGSYRLSQDHNWLDTNLENMFLDENENHIYAKAFWDWFLLNHKTFQVMRFTGGEPLISKWMDKFLDWLKTNSMGHADLAFNSNLGVPVELMEKFIQKLKLIPREHYKSLQFFTSLDGWGSGGELARYGLKLNIFEKNLNLLFDSFPSSLFRFTATLNVFAFPDIKRLFEKVYEYKQKSEYQDQVAIVSYPIFYPSFLALDWTKEIFEKYYLETLEYIDSHMAGDKNEYGFHGFEREYFEKAVNFKDDKTKNERLVDIFMYLIQFKFRKNIKELVCPDDIKHMYQAGHDILMNAKFEDFEPSIWAKVEPWIEDEAKQRQIRDYVFSTMITGEYNLWAILGVHLDYIGYNLNEEWIKRWFSHQKTRLGGFELINRLCQKDHNKYEPVLRSNILRYLPYMEDYLAVIVAKLINYHKLNWSQEEDAAMVLLSEKELSGKQTVLLNSIINR